MIRSRLGGLALFVLPCGLLAALLASLAFGDRDRPRPTVSWTSTEIVPGSPVLLEVRVPTELEVVEAVAGSERFALARAGEGLYRALVGVDLAWKGTSFPVDLELIPGRGDEPLKVRVDLFVAEKEFGQQALSLPSGMVDLSEKDSARATRESALLRETVARRGGDPFWNAGFSQPLAGRISTPFGSARTMNGKRRAPHSGVDIAAPSGEAVRSAADGVVALCSDLFFSGRTVVVDHGSGVLTLYAHLARVDVNPGQAVSRGHVLGAVGSTGRATGPHLHFAAFIRGARVDPMALPQTVSPPPDKVEPAPDLPSMDPSAPIPASAPSNQAS